MSKFLCILFFLGMLILPLPLRADAAFGSPRALQPDLLANPATEPTALAACANITTPGDYHLSANLGSNGTCFQIQTGDVKFDCQNRQIIGKNFIGKGIVVGPNVARVEISNCRISAFLYGIEIQASRAITIEHNDLSNNFDDTHGSYHGAWLGLVDGGGLRVNHSTDLLAEANVANAGANGLDVRDSARVTIRSNTTNRNSAFGIGLTNTGDSLIVNNTANDNVRWCTFPSNGRDVVVAGCDSAGILLQDGSSRNRVENNVLLGQNGDGIFVRNHTGRCGDDTIIKHNKIVGAQWNGIEAGFCDGLEIQGNEFVQSQFGVWISYMDHAVVQNNQFSRMEQTAIVLKNSSHAQIKNNVLSDSAEGLLLLGDTGDEKFGWTLRHPFAYYRSYANLVTGNIFTNVTRSIRLSDSTANQIFANRFMNAPAQAGEQASK